MTELDGWVLRDRHDEVWINPVSMHGRPMVHTTTCRYKPDPEIHVMAKAEQADVDVAEALYVYEKARQEQGFPPRLYFCSKCLVKRDQAPVMLIQSGEEL